MEVGLTWVWERTVALARGAAVGLADVAGVELLGRDVAETASGIVSFRIGGWSSEAALEELGARAFAIAGELPALEAIRISLGAWNSEEEIDRFVDAVRLLATHSPETLPPRRTLTVLE
jgi:selenocysteine lyase/cysteine desulfurase